MNSNYAGDILRELRIKREMQGLPSSQAWLAKQANVGLMTVNNLEKGYVIRAGGKRAPVNPSQRVLVAIAAALEVDVAVFFEPPPKKQRKRR